MSRSRYGRNESSESEGYEVVSCYADEMYDPEDSPPSASRHCESLDDARELAEKIIDQSLLECYEPGMTASDLRGRYSCYGRLVSILGPDTDKANIQLREFTLQRAKAIAGEKRDLGHEDRTQPNGSEILTEPALDPLWIIVSREEVHALDISTPMSVLTNLLRSPENARAYKERVDIAFHGYDSDSRELHEIEEVRTYVQKLDAEFPYWLFFLSKQMLGLQCIVFCHLLPSLTAEGKAKQHPRQLEQLLQKRWLPAMAQIAQYAGLSEKDVDDLMERFFLYLKNGRLPMPYQE